MSSSSDQIKDSYTLNNLYQKSINNVKKIEDKLYISPITGIMPNNLCGYIDFGFSLISKNIEKTIEKIDKADINKISEILKNKNQKYSISKVGYSLSISVGDISLSNGQEKMLVNGGLTNFMEILSDGSFRCRIILFSEQNSSIVSITSVVTLYSLFSEIYKSIFGESFIKNFIEAKKYEKLNVIKLFQPKIITNIDDECKIIFDNYYKEHLKKYGNNIIVNSNRVPLSGFLTLDKSAFELNKVKFNSENLYSQLFHTNYFLLGYFDEFPTIPDDENV